MRRLAACLILSLVLAAPAAAQQGRITVVAPSPEQAALRGPVGNAPAPGAEAADTSMLVLPPPVRPTSLSSSRAGGSQCRLSCSRSYYFCLAGGDDQCPQYWTRCVSSCGG